MGRRRSSVVRRTTSSTVDFNIAARWGRRPSCLNTHEPTRSSMVDKTRQNYEQHQRTLDPDSSLKKVKEVTFQNQNDFTEDQEIVNSDIEGCNEELLSTNDNMEDYITVEKENNMKDSTSYTKQTEVPLHDGSEEGTSVHSKDENSAAMNNFEREETSLFAEESEEDIVSVEKDKSFENVEEQQTEYMES
eukprot:CAMPEP_0203637006 /NCGR_PEP_ID=MMETSP0088-20131115/3422_1 /ASSEMBLY_ACC=CAM_ASM_001087 /TAXON_ID=426623 /ORGANISM="Chaetoceros affinis, Strain CCMP159" /LENGTH=189 /DNA_ID=CAMNT_0050491291 /DNA_START=141 /DNA_END=710 /DNA_ORIENTATION=-